VAGLAEILPRAGGYKVHADKIKRLGVPVYASHTILEAHGKDRVESAVIARVDKEFNPVKGSEKVFNVDTLLLAVGLSPIDELYSQAKAFGINVFAAGDAEEIAEASAAMFSGKMAGIKIAKSMGAACPEMPAEWSEKLEILKSKPGKTEQKEKVYPKTGVFPVFHCNQEIPCNPCVSVCPKKGIKLRGNNITALPYFEGNCIGCVKCVVICPGLAVTLVDFRKDENFPTVAIPFEVGRDIIKKGDFVKAVDIEGVELAVVEVAEVKDLKTSDNTLLIHVRADEAIACKIAGIRLIAPEAAGQAFPPVVGREIVKDPENSACREADSAIICRCERVALGEIKKAIQSGVRDLNQLKAVTRVCMGACGGKTCQPQIMSIYKSLGIKTQDLIMPTQRPLVMEVFLGQFCNAGDKAGADAEKEWSDF